MTKFIRHQAFDVFRDVQVTNIFGTHTEYNKCIDTVFYTEHVKVDCEEVRRSLIDHDGYPSDIVVRIAE